MRRNARLASESGVRSVQDWGSRPRTCHGLYMVAECVLAIHGPRLCMASRLSDSALVNYSHAQLCQKSGWLAPRHTVVCNDTFTLLPSWLRHLLGVHVHHHHHDESPSWASPPSSCQPCQPSKVVVAPILVFVVTPVSQYDFSMSYLI